MLFNNINRKRVTRALGLVLCMALVFAAVPAMAYFTAPRADAAAVSVTTASAMQNALTAGNSVSLEADILFNGTSNGSDYGANITRFTVPAGKDVTINLNGHSITWDLGSNVSDYNNVAHNGDPWNYIMIDNKGTCNITGTGTIKYYFKMAGDTKLDKKGPFYRANIVLVKNTGDLTIGKDVKLDGHWDYWFDETTTGSYNDSNFELIGVYNKGTADLSCNIKLHLEARSCYTGAVTGKHNSYNYSKAIGVYSPGNSTLTYNPSGAKRTIEVTSRVDFEDTTGEPDKSHLANSSCGFYTESENVYINNVDISTYVEYGDTNDGTSGGSVNECAINSVGIMYATNPPTLGEAVNSVSGQKTDHWDGDNTTPAIDQSAVSECAGLKTVLNDGVANCNATVTTGAISGTASYKDEYGNTYTCGKGTSSMSGGCCGAVTGYRVVTYYRYYPTSAMNTAQYITRFPGTGNTDDGYCYRSVPAVFNGLNNGMLPNGTALSYRSGGEATNPNYWTLSRITYRVIGAGAGVPEDLNRTAGTTMTRWGNNPLNNAFGPSTITETSVLYVFVDYYKKSATTARVNIGDISATLDKFSSACGEVSMEYTGKSAVPGEDFNLAIFDDCGDLDNYSNDEDITARYNIANKTSGGRKVTYSWGTELGAYSNADSLPVDAGTYYVKATVPNDTTYTRYATGTNDSRNVQGTDFVFQLNITKKTPVISGPAALSCVYGTKLANLDKSGYTVTASNVAQQPSSGSFSFKTPDRIIAPSEGAQTVVLQWTPSGVTAHNYNSTSINVRVTATKRSITVTPVSKSIIYGSSELYANEDVTIGGDGLVYPTDANYVASVITDLVANLRVRLPDSSTTAYRQGLDVGSYTITGSGDTPNYIVSYNEAALQITPKALTLTAAAYNRGYDGTNTVTVSFPADGIQGFFSGDAIGSNDGLIVENVTGTVERPAGGSPGDVGDNLRVYFSAPALSGAKAGNYTISTADITNYSNLRINITKAAPVVAAPVLAPVVYDSTKTLYDHFGVDIAASREGETSGKWQFPEETRRIVPQVRNFGYTAVFIPDSDNYATTEYTIPVNVSKRQITVSVSCPEIYYGDDVPVFSYAFDGFTNENPSDETAEYINVIGQTINAEGFSLSGELPTIESYGNYTNDAGNRSPAGTYTITWSQALTADNYVFVSAEACNLVVNKRILTIQAKNASVEYGNNMPAWTNSSYIVTGLVDGDTIDQIVAESGAITRNTTYVAGSPVVSAGYPININALTENDSYDFRYVSGKLTVTKATLTLTPDDKEVTYGEPVPALTYTYSGWKGGDAANAASLVSGEPILTTTYTVTSSVDMTYTITAGTGNIVSANYNIVPEEGIITVRQATPTVTVWPTATVENGKSYSSAVLTGGTANVPGTYEFKTDDYPVYGQTNTAVIVFTPRNTNYKAVEGTITVTVAAKAVTGNPVIKGDLMVGETLTVDTSSMDPALYSTYSDNIVWKINNAVVSTSETYTLTAADKGYTVTVTVTADDSTGYTGAKSATTDDKVSAAKAKPTVDGLSYAIPTDLVYDGQTHAVDVTKNELNYGEITVYYNGSKAAPKAAGTYVVTCNISATAMFGAKSGLELGTLTIAKAPLYLSFTANDKVYDGKTTATIDATTISTIGKIGADDVSINTSAATYTFEEASAGDHEIVVKNAVLEGVAKDNYQIVVNDVVATINPKPVTVEGTTVTRVYDPEKDYVVVNFGTISGLLTADRSKVKIENGKAYLVNNGASNEAAVSYVDFDITGASADNYEITVSNESDLYGVITKATPSVTVPAPDAVVYSGSQTLAQIPLTAGWTWQQPTTIPTVNTASYKAVYTPADSANYTTVTADIALTVTKATATITVNPVNITYGDPKPAFTVTASGFTGEDSLATCGGLLKFQTDYVQFSPVGEYTANAGVQSTLFNANYNFEYVDGRILVGQKELVVTPTAVNRGYIAGGGAEAYEVTVNFSDLTGRATSADDVNLSATTVTGTINDPNAGTRSVTYAMPTLIGNKASNYYLTITNPNIAVEILKIQPTGYSFPTEARVSYGQTLAYAVFTGGSGDGDFAFTDPTIVADRVGTFQGVYEVTFTPWDYVNYDSVSRYVKTIITENELTIAVNLSGSMYSGSTITAAVSGLSKTAEAGYTHYYWYRVKNNGAVAVGTDSAQYELTKDDIGCKIRVDVILDSPFSGEATVTSARAVEEEQLDFWAKLRRWWYRILAAITGLFDNVHI